MADVPIERISPAEKEAEEERLANRKRDAWNESDSCGLRSGNPENPRLLWPA